MKKSLILPLLLTILTLPACSLKVNLFSPSAQDPLKEVLVEGQGEGKIALIQLTGIIDSQPGKDLLTPSPSPVQELVSRLKLAEMDDDVRGILLAIDSPGGSVTGSDILFHEIQAFKERSGKKVVVGMFDIAASGGYYAALPAHWIMAHPTTMTGSVGVIYIRPKVTGLMEKIGVAVETSKSGKDKDMGSPFRATGKEEEQLFQGIIDNYANRFHTLVMQHRKLSKPDMELVKTARVFTADEALEVGLIDEIGYVQDMFTKTRLLSGLEKDAKVVAYRRLVYPNDNPYNTMSSADAGKLNLLGASTKLFLPPAAGFYYAWPQGMAH